MDNTIYQFSSRTLQGKEISFDQFRGKVILIVNTATHCGQAPQLKGLEEVYKQYYDRGLIVIGFPSAQFDQEPLEGSAIREFCSVNYGVTFPMMEKIILKGKDAHPIFNFFSDKKQNGKIASKPYWNFYKYLIGRDGKVIDYFITYRFPKSKKIINAIEKALGGNN